MTEKDRRDAGLLYDPDGAELAAERLRCKEACFRFNALSPTEEEARTTLLRALLGHLGEGVRLLSPFECDYGYNIHLSSGVFINHGCVILDGAAVTLGRGVLVGPLTGFYTAIHPLKAEERRRGLEQALPITVGDNVWIGGGVQVLAGVTIGANAVIGAGSVVTRDIAANTVAAGVPCRILRTL